MIQPVHLIENNKPATSDADCIKIIQLLQKDTKEVLVAAFEDVGIDYLSLYLAHKINATIDSKSLLIRHVCDYDYFCTYLL